MLRCLANSTHSRVPLMPPCRVGFMTKYWGRMVSNRRHLSSVLVTPISSSSKAMSMGEASQSLAISSHCPWRMGCSIECIPYSASLSSLPRASLGAKAPFASRRSSMSLGLKRSRRARTMASSCSKPMPPIFSLTHEKPALTFSSTRRVISSKEPIHTNPFILMPFSPRANARFPPRTATS